MLAQVKSRGLLYVIGIAINRVVPEFLFRARVFGVYRFASPDASSSQASYDDGIRFQWCKNEQEFKLAEELTFFRLPDSDQQNPFRACLAFDGGKAVGGVWIANGSFGETELGLKIQLQPSQRWLFAANVAKSHRQRGIYGRMLRYVLWSVGQDGVQTEILASINPTNKASMAAHRRMIAETLGKCIAARFLSLGFCISTGDLTTTKPIGIGSETLVEVRST
ncbi:hypothetical protein LF1_03920 [Rubripirellula obstinata]|uniref:N-acetyltransferase domain-containing protein n=1 Tax=Rubripirellula obstinata TaxID=406547 RepID=A0A5B1CCG2_9BACT|nr:GNAT family N-acetyltransferase [Rubripirellula obstinata]KAA1257902.1 hypothetical protein LF1_03920 [Rubripirellula obstinata]